MLPTFNHYIADCFRRAWTGSIESAINWSGVIGAAILALLGQYLLGRPIVFDDASAAGIIGAFIVFTVAAWAVLFVFRLIFAAPFSAWKDSQDKIVELAAAVRPALELEIEREGAIYSAEIAATSYSWSGKPTTNIWGNKTFIRLLCTNRAEVTAPGCSAYLLSVGRVAPGGHLQDVGYVDNLPLTWSVAGSDHQGALDVQPHVKHYVNVLTRQAPQGPPLIATPKLPSKHVWLFKESGIYELRVQVSGERIAPAQFVFRIRFDQTDGDLSVMDMPSAVATA